MRTALKPHLCIWLSEGDFSIARHRERERGSRRETDRQTDRETETDREREEKEGH